MKNLVCVLPTWVGDAVMVTPALRALRVRFPEARLTVFGRGHLLPMLDGAGLFDDSVAAAGKGNLRANVAALRGIGADLAVIFPHSFRSAWQVFRAGIPRRVGYRRDGRGWLLTHTVEPHRVRGRIVPVPMIYQYLELVALVGAVSDGDGPRLSIPDDVRRRGERDLKQYGIIDGDRVVVLNPGASFGSSKIWPVESLARVGDRLVREGGYKVLIFCGPGEEPLARELAGHMKAPVINTADAVLPLDRCKVILERASLLITTDTGPRHMSVSLGTPAVVIMGPTDARYTNSHLGRTIVLQREVPCGPCHLKVCPLDHRCMNEITDDDVLTAARRLLVTTTDAC